VSTPQDRQRAFEEWTAERLGGFAGWKVNHAFGVSNSAKVIEGGLQLAVLNMATFSTELRGWLLLSLLRFAPSDEVLFGLAVEGQALRAAVSRVGAMSAAGGGDRSGLNPRDELTYSARANNVSVYLHRSGRLYLRNRGFWDTLPTDLSPYGPGIEVSHAFVEVHALDPTRRGQGADEFVSHLASFLDQAPLDRRALQPTELHLPGVRELRVRFEELGGRDEDGVLERLHLALSTARGIAVIAGLGRAGPSFVERYARSIQGGPLAVSLRTPRPEGPLIHPGDRYECSLVIVDLDAAPSRVEDLGREAKRREGLSGVQWPLIVGLASEVGTNGLADAWPVIVAR